MSSDVKQFKMGLGFKLLLVLDLVAMYFSGFGQMPIYARYYITNLPGLGWSGDFHLNSVIHYGAGAMFLALTAYYLVVRVAVKGQDDYAKWGWYGLLAALALIISGATLVFRDVGGVVLPNPLIVTTILIHLGSAMATLALIAAYFGLGRVRSRRQS